MPRGTVLSADALRFAELYLGEAEKQSDFTSSGEALQASDAFDGLHPKESMDEARRLLPTPNVKTPGGLCVTARLFAELCAGEARG